jgi:hypothetical protein
MLPRSVLKTGNLKTRHSQGGWIGLVIAAASAIFGRKDKKKADSQASDDRQRELDLEERGVVLAERQDERAAELYGHYRDTYMPREEALVSEAFDRPISPAAAERRSLGDVRQAFQNQREIQTRNKRRLGVDPGSGASLSLDAGLGLEEARVEAGSRTRAREGVRDLNFGRQATVLGYGSPTAATPYAAGAQSGVNAAAGLAGARASDSARNAYEAAGNYGAALGELVDSGLEAWRKRRENQQEAA